MSFSMDEIKDIFAKGRQKAKKRVIDNKHILFDVFDSKAVIYADVSFDGSGDSGGVEDVILYAKNDTKHPEEMNILKIIVNGVKIYQGTQFSLEGVSELISDDPSDVENLIHSICYDILKSEHEGWENNDGAHGEFHFSSEDRRIELNFYERSSKLYEYEF